MAEIVNLRIARKRTARADKERTAQENRLRHGRTKSQKQTERSDAEQAIRRLDAHRLAPGSN